MSFKILYDGGDDVNQQMVKVAVYVDAFVKALGISSMQVDLSRLTSVASSLIHPDFPHVDGVENASPFKKAANFFVWFVAERPIIDPISPEIIGPDLHKIQNHQNVILAYHMSVDCLHRAVIHRKDEKIELKEKIKVSNHYFSDFVEAFSAATPAHHFKIVSLLFEQLAYKANPTASYPEVI